MTVLDLIRGRNDSRHVHEIATAETETNEPKTEANKPKSEIEAGPDVAVDTSHDESDRNSLEARNEKEIMQHPNEVTSDAQLGVKKIEAAALVWSKKSVYATYVW